MLEKKALLITSKVGVNKKNKKNTKKTENNIKRNIFNVINVSNNNDVMDNKIDQKTFNCNNEDYPVKKYEEVDNFIKHFSFINSVDENIISQNLSTKNNNNSNKDGGMNKIDDNNNIEKRNYPLYSNIINLEKGESKYILQDLI